MDFIREAHNSVACFSAILIICCVIGNSCIVLLCFFLCCFRLSRCRLCFYFRLWLRCGTYIGIHDLFRAWRRVCILVRQALLRAYFYAAAALDALHSVDRPGSSGPVNDQCVGRTFLLADTAVDAVFDLVFNVAPCSFLPTVSE